MKLQNIIRNNKEIISYISLILFYLIIDIIMRYFCITSSFFYSIKNIAPIIFSLSIISVHITFIKCLPKKGAITYYLVTSIFYIIMMFVQYFHYNVLGSFFTFSEIFLAGEGLDFVNSIFQYINYKIIILIFFFIILITINIYLIIKTNRSLKRKKTIFIILGVSILLQISGYFIIKIDNNGYNDTDIDSLIYNYKTFNIPYKSIQTTGFMQYPFQDITIYYKNLLSTKINRAKNVHDIDKYLSKRNLQTANNEYTGIFKDKNLIYIMLESGDDWLITENTMPTLYKLKKEGWDFTNRYSPFFYAGYTFNSEFAANTGYYLIEGFGEYINNSYPNSLPNLFKNAGYKVNSFHMNNGEFYNREEFHKSFGYEKYNGNYYYDQELNKGFNYVYDTSWVRNDTSYNKIISRDEKFMSFLITYSMHMPYFNNGICEQAIRDKKIVYKPWEERENICIKELAGESDLMITELIERLEEDKLLDDTILIIFADHNTYGYSDKNYLASVKGTSDLNLQQKTPLIIWGKDIEQKQIDKLVDTADLVPTIANLFGLKYNANDYLATDVFANYHDNYIYFQYGEWLDETNNYSKSANKKEFKDIQDKVNNIMYYNKIILQTDYFNKN